EEGVLDPDRCRHVVSKEVFDRWGLALCESALGQNAFYCPYKDCSALLTNDCSGVGCRVTIKASCPHCRTLPV
ncbi:IBR domain, partial [Musa troglodytarum]